MVDRKDKLRHNRVAHYASVQREKTQPSQAVVVYSPIDAKMSAYGAHASPPSSPLRRRVTHTHASPPPSFRRTHVSPIQAYEAPENPQTHEAPQASEGFRGGSSDLSLLPLYPDHISRHCLG